MKFSDSIIHTLIDIRACYEKSEILADEDLLGEALCGAEYQGILAFHEEGSSAKVPLLFKSRPLLKRCWEEGFNLSEERFAMQNCSECHTGNPCRSHY